MNTLYPKINAIICNINMLSFPVNTLLEGYTEILKLVFKNTLVNSNYLVCTRK